MVKLVCWNTAYRRKSWCCLRDMDVDVALVQEACNPPQDVLSAVDTGPREHWDPTTWNSDWWVGRWRHLTDRKTMIVKRSDTVRVEWFKQVAPISCVAKDEIAVSGIGTIAAARVIPPKGKSFVAVSMYARWIAPHPTTRSKWRVGYSDGSAHRIISVPTYYTRAECSATATRQLDYVFASRGFHERVTVRALNEVDAWGPSDHCRILIEVD